MSTCRSMSKWALFNALKLTYCAPIFPNMHSWIETANIRVIIWIQDGEFECSKKSIKRERKKHQFIARITACYADAYWKFLPSLLVSFVDPQTRPIISHSYILCTDLPTTESECTVCFQHKPASSLIQW